MKHACFFLAQHVCVTGRGSRGDALTDTKEIGLFLSLAEAKSAIAQVKDAAGFRDFADGFSICRVRVHLSKGMAKQAVHPDGFDAGSYIVGKICWSEGFTAGDA